MKNRIHPFFDLERTDKTPLESEVRYLQKNKPADFIDFCLNEQRSRAEYALWQGTSSRMTIAKYRALVYDLTFMCNLSPDEVNDAKFETYERMRAMKLKMISARLKNFCYRIQILLSSGFSVEDPQFTRLKEEYGRMRKLSDAIERAEDARLMFPEDDDL